MEFQWINESTVHHDAANDTITIYAPAKTDFFRGSIQESAEGSLPEVLSNAPFYYTQVKGNFVMRVQVTLDFQDTYDSASIMVMKDMRTWAKACFEQTDFGTHAAVSVVTNQVSDDANHNTIQENALWLQVCRVGNSFAFHYSIDGEHFYMTRQFWLPVDDVLKVGLLAQAPTGNGGNRMYRHLTIEQHTVANIRAGR